MITRRPPVFHVNAPTIDRLRAELAHVTAERDAAVSLVTDLYTQIRRIGGFMKASDQMLLRRAASWLVEWGRL